MNKNVRHAKMQNLINGVIGFITSNYPMAVIQTVGNVTYVGFSGEKPRIAFVPNYEQHYYQFYITKNFNETISEKDARRVLLVSEKDLPVVRATIGTILSLEQFEVKTKLVKKSSLPELPQNHAYLVDHKFNVLGVVDQGEIINEEEDKTETEVIEKIASDNLENKIDDEYKPYYPENKIIYEENGAIPTIYKFLEKPIKA